MHNHHEQVKGQLQDSINKYKKKVDLRKREVNFEYVDMVVARLRK